MVLWYLQTFMVDSYLLTLPESESAGTRGEKLYERKTKWPQNVTVKLNNDYYFLNKVLRDLVMVASYMFSISRNTMEHIMNN